MAEGPRIARIAELIGDRARAQMLTSLMHGQALAAGELAATAGISAATASAHLAKLVEAGLVIVRRQGRHRYFELGGPQVAQLLESLIDVAARGGAMPLQRGPRDLALRRARVCYDHLAGELAVAAADAMLAGGVLIVHDGQWLAAPGSDAWWRDTWDIALPTLAAQRRPLCRACLDWSERRPHLAGALGASMLEQVLARDWARRLPDSRVVAFTPAGEIAWRERIAPPEPRDVVTSGEQAHAAGGK